MTTLTLKEEDYTTFTAEQVAEIATRLELDDYKSPFDGLQDWHLLRALAFHRQDLVEPYFYLLDIEAYDES
ncbi:DUF2555 domain-containing protein [Geminocystis sp. GBBB08]|uniref:protein IsiD n=1 Tax=Geminocystis sp. GBBB08 TaxID=2604140 RepID=UPI0027E284C1|nr:DUF2555 domain-containing protein [Geminocystis sp. GBBB08]MBL1209159.1 DUF2555 domain-containing protein [Geminocystis sp. GBBB08]